MKILAEHKIAQYIEVLDLNTGEFIQNCLWVDPETGEYEKAITDETNNIIMNRSNFDTVIKKGNIVVVYKGE